MKISVDWLKDYVDITLPIEELTEKLTMVGLEVKSISKGRDKDKILDIEVTPNRPDCLSVIGIAREVAAITGNTSHQSYPSGHRQVTNHTLIPLRAQAGTGKSPAIEIEIQDKEGCLKYTARIISNIKIQPSPQWMQRRLLDLGSKPINNVVDITNYVMLEWGQPLHAFDFEKIKSVQVSSFQFPVTRETKKIIIRKAKAGEKIITLDSEEKELDSEILVIADSERPLAIAGIIGGEKSGVNKNTETILLEAACFEPSQIRKASRKLAVSTESSYRFERGVSLRGVDLAAERALQLLEEFARGRLEEIKEVGQKEAKEKEVELHYNRVGQILGIDISEQRIKEILKDLQFEITFFDKQKLKVKVPYFRFDIKEESDLIEEIARIFGYQNIPIAMPKVKISSFSEGKDRLVNRKAKEILISSNFEEAISHSLISKQALIKENQGRKIISIANPLTSEQEIMRPTLFFNALNIIAWNFRHKVETSRIFEIGKVYYEDEERKIYECENLALAMFGKKKESWRAKERELDFYDLKGAVEKLLSGLGIIDYLFIKENDPRFSHLCTALKIGDKKIGVLGKVSSDVLAHYDMEEGVYICELNFRDLVYLVNFKKEFKSIPKYPSVRRDIALLVKNEITCEKIISLIRATGGKLINNIYLFDIYKGKQVAKGYKSLAFSIEYQAKEKTLIDEEINSIDTKIRRQLFEKLGAVGR